MNDKSIFTQILAVPILALFIGVAVLAGAAALSWDRNMTQAALTGLYAICGAGIVVFGLPIGFFVGLSLYRRMVGPRESAALPGHWNGVNLPALPYREQQAPALDWDDADAGSWASNGPASYNLANPSAQPGYQRTQPRPRQWR